MPPEPPNRRTPVLAIVLLVVVEALAVAWALWWDVFVADYALTPLPVLALGIVWFPALVVTLLSLGVPMPRTARLVSVAVLAAVLVLPFVPWHPRKLFAQRLRSLDAGMTVDQVESVMGGYVRGMGAKWAVPDGPPPPVADADAAEDPADEAHLRRRVAAAQERYVPPGYGNAFERAHFSGPMTYRWNDRDGAYDSDFGIVRFDGGRVVKVEFLRD